MSAAVDPSVVGYGAYSIRESRGGSSQSFKTICARVSKFVLGLGCIAGSVILGCYFARSYEELGDEVRQTPSPMPNVTQRAGDPGLRMRSVGYAIGCLATGVVGVGLCAEAIKSGLGKYVSGVSFCLAGVTSVFYCTAINANCSISSGE